jgi:hypothetical protein
MAEEKRGVIDRFEGDLAVIVFDDGERLELPRAQLPAGAQVGDALVMRMPGGTVDSSAMMQAAAQGALSIEVDAEDTAVRRQRVQSLLDDIFKKKPPSK